MMSKLLPFYQSYCRVLLAQGAFSKEKWLKSAAIPLLIASTFTPTKATIVPEDLTKSMIGIESSVTAKPSPLPKPLLEYYASKMFENGTKQTRNSFRHFRQAFSNVYESFGNMGVGLAKGLLNAKNITSPQLFLEKARESTEQFWGKGVKQALITPYYPLKGCYDAIQASTYFSLSALGQGVAWGYKYPLPFLAAGLLVSPGLGLHYMKSQGITPEDVLKLAAKKTLPHAARLAASFVRMGVDTCSQVLRIIFDPQSPSSVIKFMSDRSDGSWLWKAFKISIRWGGEALSHVGVKIGSEIAKAVSSPSKG